MSGRFESDSVCWRPFRNFDDQKKTFKRGHFTGLSARGAEVRRAREVTRAIEGTWSILCHDLRAEAI